jgi:hypothetical protein
VNDRTQEALIEAVVSPHRERDREGRPVPPPEWWDLPPEAQEEAFREALAARRLEKALDPEGRSGTVRAVLGRLAGM